VTSGGPHVEITDNADLLRVVEEVRRTKRPCVLSRDHEPIAVISPVRKATRARQPSEADLAATRSAAGGWKGLVDVVTFKRENRRQKRIAGRPLVEL
jgi:hypothetical protein